MSNDYNTEDFLKEIAAYSKAVSSSIIAELGLPEQEEYIIPWSEYVAKLSFSIGRAMAVEKYATQTKH